MKKTVSLILCAVMLLSALVFAVPASAAGTVDMTVKSKSTDPMNSQGTLTVTFTMNENAGLNALALTLDYNRNTLEFDSASNGVVFSSENNADMTGCNSSVSPIKIMFAHNGTGNVTATGKIVSVKFNIINDMGTFDVVPGIDVENTSFSGSGGESITLNLHNEITKNTQHIDTGLPSTIKPTCTEPGRIEKRCTTCNKILSVVPTSAALGHDWDEVDRAEPTENEDGWIEYECLRCGETMTEILPKTGGGAILSGTYKVDGDTLTLTLDLAKNPGINTLVATLAYNANALEFVNAANGSVFSSANNGSMFGVNGENDPLILYFEENGVGNITANGKVATLTFKVLDSSADFGFVLAVDSDNTFGADENNLPVDVLFDDCTIKELTYIIGDVNGDGKINAVDANLCRRVILGTDEYTPAADINGDGKVNAIDGNLIIRLILGD